MQNRIGQFQVGTSKSDGKREVEERSKEGKTKKRKSEAWSDTNKSKIALTQKYQAYKPSDAIKTYTPLNTIVAQILMQIQYLIC